MESLIIKNHQGWDGFTSGGDFFILFCFVFGNERSPLPTPWFLRNEKDYVEASREKSEMFDFWEIALAVNVISHM